MSMTVAELIDHLESLPQDAEVRIAVPGNAQYPARNLVVHAGVLYLLGGPLSPLPLADAVAEEIYPN